MNNKFKNIIIGVLSVLLIIAIIIIVVVVTKKDNSVFSVKGHVIAVGDGYVILESNNKDYVVNNLKGVYNLEDELEIKYQNKDVDLNENPVLIKKVIDEDLIKVKYKDENKDSEIKNDNHINNEQIDSNNNTIHNDIIKEDNKFNNNKEIINNTDNSIKDNNLNNNVSKSADQEVLGYFDALEKDFNSSEIKNSVKSGFITVVDFIFYDGSIKGHTFKELSNSAKLKVLKMALYFDSKIEKYFPDYKETISSNTKKVYTNVKGKIVSSYLNLTASVCSKNDELCMSAKNGFQELKKNFGLTWDLIKDIAGDGLHNIKSWYEIWSGK